MDALGNHLECHNIDSSELHDFIDDANLDQFIDLIRGGEGEDPIANFDCELMINGCLDDYNLFGPASTTPPSPDVSQVEEKGFYVKVACNKGQVVATALYKALESLARFNVQSSNLNTVSADRFELAFTLNAMFASNEGFEIVPEELGVMLKSNLGYAEKQLD
ncbi:hypothetical protein C1H46_035039 [Malus baccata]|uniref:Uncharacterized protein n=1 Tax=Malus baccata TaxID=106549 RepID=A0A540KZ69_MALBA|nr:hypothetical protein C1H46_035039 [Malus baccata]